MQVQVLPVPPRRFALHGTDSRKCKFVGIELIGRLVSVKTELRKQVVLLQKSDRMRVVVNVRTILTTLPLDVSNDERLVVQIHLPPPKDW